MKKKLRDAAISAATVSLLLYAAMTAAKSMADALQPGAAAAVSCQSAAVAGSCKSGVEVARGDD